MLPRDARQPVLAGVVLAVVGFTGAFAVVLAGLRAAGADADQAASGLIVLTVVMGLLTLGLSLRTRMPIAIAWSTPGAALLIASGPPSGGWPAAVGAFVVAGALAVLAGLWSPLRRAIAAVPAPLASALLAGVLLPVCVEPARGVVERPELITPIVVTWALLLRFARPWAVPGALAAAVVAVAVSGTLDTSAVGDPWPQLTFTAPTFALGAIVGLALPLFVVTMASQNLTGLSVLELYGYRPPLREVLASTGAASVAIAPFGGHGVNLAAITMALAAGPDAGSDPSRRWIAGVSAGVTKILIGLAAGFVTALVAASPPQVAKAVAGVALLGALAGALQAAVGGDEHREAATVALVVTVSGLTALGIASPFWGLLAGLAMLGLQRARAAAN